MRLKRSFFARSTLQVARDLIGMRLVRRIDGQCLSGRIVEVEAYIGQGDTACHASRGKTARNSVLFGPPGYAYVYFTYGMHWMLNVVTEKEGFPAAVLLRAIEPEEGIELMRRKRRGCPDRQLAAGPARLCQALAIESSLNRTDLVEGDDLFFENSKARDSLKILRTPRVGIDYARRADREALWRFVLEGSPFVSRARPQIPGGSSRLRRESEKRRRTGVAHG